jgi:hypothetical protein
MKGRRLAIINLGTKPEPMLGTLPEFTQPGDYCGPIMGYTGDKPAVFYLLPIARDIDVHGEARSLHHVVSPPHTFTEEPDGTLTISASIKSPYWHGFLEKGVWRTA